VRLVYEISVTPQKSTVRVKIQPEKIKTDNPVIRVTPGARSRSGNSGSGSMATQVSSKGSVHLTILLRLAIKLPESLQLSSFIIPIKHQPLATTNTSILHSQTHKPTNPSSTWHPPPSNRLSASLCVLPNSRKRKPQRPSPPPRLLLTTSASVHQLPSVPPKRFAIRTVSKTKDVTDMPKATKAKKKALVFRANTATVDGSGSSDIEGTPDHAAGSAWVLPRVTTRSGRVVKQLVPTKPLMKKERGAKVLSNFETAIVPTPRYQALLAETNAAKTL
jgi:hypothetical protein